MAIANMPTLLLEVDFANTNTWVDITGDLRNGQTKRGSSRVDGPVVRYEAGQATFVVDNRTRQFDPTNLSGPHTSGGATQVLPGRPIRLRATWNSVTYNLWRGFVDAWDVAYVKGDKESTVTIRATDGIKLLSRFNGSATSPAGAGEDTGARVTRVLDNAGWSASLRNIATGDTTVQATTLAANAWSELLLTADTENGAIFIDGAGKVTFINRHAQINGTSVATFGDSGSELRYVEVGVEYDEQTILNLFRIARAGGTEQVQQDSASIAAYTAGIPSTYNRTDLLMQDDDTANNWAGWGLYQSKDPELRFPELVVNPLRSPSTLWPHVLGREIADRITVRRRPSGGGSLIERDVFIRGASHTFDSSSWSTSWPLQSASKFAFFVLDDPVLGVLDANAISY